MKKSLFAIAAAGAFAGAAQAQSSVTVYGIIDVGYIGANQIQASNGVNTISNAAIAKSTFSGIGSGAQSTNRLGFRGTEDLGGGTSAFFTYEIALGINDQNSLASNGTSTSLAGTGVANQNRQAFVGLSQKGLGQLALGTQYTPIFNAAALTSAGGLNNIMGDMINTNGTTMGYSVTASTRGAPTAQPSTSLASSSTAGYTVRGGNMLTLRTENMGGIVANAFVMLNNSNNTQGTTDSTNESGGPNNRSGYGGGLNYSVGKFLATANYQYFKATNPFGAGDIACTGSTMGTTTCTSNAGSVSVFGGAPQTGTNVADTQYYLAATYDFGFIKAYAQYINRKWVNQLNPSVYGVRNAQQIGVKGNISPKVEYWGSIGNGTYKPLVSAVAASTTAVANNQNIIGYQLGANYWLSKRTNLYAIFGGYGASTQSSSSSAVANSAYNGNNYAAGIRHTF